MTSKLIRREQCPECKKNGRDVSEDNLGVFDDDHEYCFSCSYYSSPEGNRTSLDRERETTTYEYLAWRGVSAGTFRTFDTLTKVGHDGKPISTGFRYPSGSTKVRLIDKKEFYWVGTPKPGLFGIDKFAAGGSKFVTITEGELDACSLYQVLGKAPVVSVQSAATAGRDCAADFEFLNSFERVYLAFDNDAAGRLATAAVARLFDYNKVFVVKLHPRKDANEWLELGKGEELRHLWWNSRRYLPETVVSSFSDFKEILKGPTQTGVPYPFKQLTGMTYGIRTGESVLITAPEKVGKTELMHFIEYQLLTGTKDNVGAIYLEEPKRRHLQALAAIRLGKPVHLPDCHCEEDEVLSAVEGTIGSDDRLHLYSHFGSSDPDVLLDTIRFLATARACRFILLDHISMVVSGLSGEDERRTLDYLATRLEMMVKELDFALIIVSHVNDDGKTRGSRYISKVCDIRIDASRDLTSADPIERNTIYLTVALNRFSGLTGPAGKVLFNLPTYSFTEAANDNFEQQKREAA